MSALSSVLRTPPARAIVFTFLVTVAYLAWTLFFDWSPAVEHKVSAVCLSLPNLFFSYFVFRMIRSFPMEPKLRQSWTLLASAILFTVVADIIYILSGRPALSWADPFFIGFYFLFYFGILRLPFRSVSNR